MPDFVQFWGPAAAFALILAGYVAWMVAVERRRP